MNNKMKYYRNSQNMTQKECAKNLGIAVSTYNMIENNNRGVSLILAKRISNLFNKTIEEIFFAN